jgi:AraC family transcriptional regulator, positive regulator of tynA and feaB
MGVVFDAETLAPRERLEALNAAIAMSDLPQQVSCADGVLGAHRVELYQLGPGVQLMRNVGSSLLVNRTARHVRMAAPEIVSMGVAVSGSAGLLSPHAEGIIGQGHLDLVDTTAPYSYVQARAARAEHSCLIMSREQLGLPFDVVHAAVPSLRASPLYELVRNHFAELSRLSVDLSEPAQGRLGWATVQLARALLTTAAGDSRSTETLHESLMIRVRAFIEHHLDDPSLDPAMIAAAHHVSVRHLYGQWSRGGGPRTLAEWIMHRRLDRAHGMLADAGSRALPVAAVARECGFTDMAHFSRRFRQAYGTSPRGWRAQAQETTAQEG